MLHYARRTLPGTLLFTTWAEAGWLWRAMGARVPGIVALTLMPDHLHLLVREPVDKELTGVLRGYAMWRSRRDPGAGRTFRRGDPPAAVEGRLKERRNERYISLNPCRARLVDDPLSWPFSTHRDAVGLCVGALRKPAADPHRLHAYVSSDPSVQVHGSELPQRGGQGQVDLDQVRAAVSALTRQTLDELERAGAARRLLMGAALQLVPLAQKDLAAQLGCHRSTLDRVHRLVPSADVRLVERVLGDPRFSGLADGDVRKQLRRRGWPAP